MCLSVCLSVHYVCLSVPPLFPTYSTTHFRVAPVLPPCLYSLQFLFRPFIHSSRRPLPPCSSQRPITLCICVCPTQLMTFRSDSVCQRNMIFLARRISEPFTQNRWRQPWTPPIDEDSNADDDDGLAKGRETMELFVIVSDTSLPPFLPLWHPAKDRASFSASDIG